MKLAIPATFLLLLFVGCGGGGGETTTYEVPSESMQPAFLIGEQLTVELEAYRDDEPEIGDVVVFHPPMGAENLSGCGVRNSRDQACPQPTSDQSSLAYLKRVVATPGDELEIREGLPIVNGEEVLADVIEPCRGGGACDLPEAITIPPDHFFMLGDNSGTSDDSRFWGPVPIEAVVGRVDE